MKTTVNAPAAARLSVAPDRWEAELSALVEMIAPRFARVEPVRHAAAMIAGMHSGLDRKNCWTLAEHAGHATPHGLQHLLARARWDADGVRDDLRGYVGAAFGRDGAVLVVDETGDVKKGTATVGAQRQHTGTAGRIENAQVAVYLAYASPAGHAFIDRALYLPKSWREDAGRCRRAGVGEADRAFATKPALAAAMVARAVHVGVRAGWVAGDEVYGADHALRATIRGHGLGYVLTVAANRVLPTRAGDTRADAAAALVPGNAWRVLSAGTGSKGHRRYWWAWVELEPENAKDESLGGFHHLLARRNDTTDEHAYLRCYSPLPVPLAELVRVAGQRWRVEEGFQSAKTLTGLDQHQIRTWTSWQRWSVLAMLAHAFLAVSAAAEHARQPQPDGAIALTVNEFRRLYDALVPTARHSPAHLIGRSTWRRRHQHHAQQCHFNRRTNNDHDLRL